MRVSSGTIVNRAKLDIEEVIGAELIRARKKQQIEQFRSRWCKLGVIKVEKTSVRTQAQIDQRFNEVVAMLRAAFRQSWLLLGHFTQFCVVGTTSGQDRGTSVLCSEGS
ncbi:uncharacterized protein VTP21DRAFT_11658 [Calcarisporiella thermophila]|uniref:uncharacterized protein n=1 Tax=Calcarisporiella thermophila TaxID=911321 RepID=UPI00374449DD